MIGLPGRPLYPFTGTGFSRASKGWFRNSDSFWAHLVSSSAKAFALVLAKAVVVTPHPLQDKIHRIVKLFLSNSQLKLTSNMSICLDPKEETSFRVPLFSTVLLPLPQSLGP